MKKLIIATSFAFFAVAAQAQDLKPLNIARLPVRADAPLLFAPRGWKIEKRVSGNLNGDKIADAALVLVENKPAKDASGDPTARQRALVILVREGKGWHRVGFNGELLAGTRDGGAFYGFVETPVDVSIARSNVIVKMEAGSREVSNSTQRLRYIPAKKGIYLIGSDSVTNDRLTGDVVSTSSNFLTGIKKTRTINGKTDKQVTKTSRVSKNLRSLESLRESDRFAE